MLGGAKHCCAALQSHVATVSLHWYHNIPMHISRQNLMHAVRWIGQPQQSAGEWLGLVAQSCLCIGQMRSCLLPRAIHFV